MTPDADGMSVVRSAGSDWELIEMADYRIDKSDDGVEINVKGVHGDQQARLLEAFKECQEGRCSCPTQEYRKLESLEVATEEDGINLRLHAKAGAEMDASEIAKCLDYTVAKASGDDEAN